MGVSLCCWRKAISRGQRIKEFQLLCARLFCWIAVRLPQESNDHFPLPAYMQYGVAFAWESLLHASNGTTAIWRTSGDSMSWRFGLSSRMPSSIWRSTHLVQMEWIQRLHTELLASHSCIHNSIHRTITAEKCMQEAAHCIHH